MKYKRKIKAVLIMALIVMVIMGTVVIVYSDNTVKGLADNMIRLHIIAESDEAIDQEVKLKVRDAILEYLTEKMDVTMSVEETTAIIDEELPNIERIAAGILEENGHEGLASAEYGNFIFPTKQYENIELPSGRYNALRVTLGKGEGKNWWCVVFPPLCFADSAEGKISEEADQMLQENLSDSQYSIITSTDDDENIPVRFKFKLVEMVQDTKTALGNIFSGIFG